MENVDANYIRVHGSEKRINDSERERWILNCEPLYNCWIASRKSLSTFIRANRTEIDHYIFTVLGQ